MLDEAAIINFSWLQDLTCCVAFPWLCGLINFTHCHCLLRSGFVVNILQLESDEIQSRNLTATCGCWHHYWNNIIFVFIYKIWAKCKAASAVSCMGLRRGHAYSLFINESVGCFNYKETKFPVDTAQDGKHWVKWLHCSGCLHEIPLCLVVSAECSNHALPCRSLFKHKSTWKADFLFHRLSRFLLSDEEPGQNNNCWPETIQCSFDLHVIFKSALQAHSVDDKVLIKCLQGQISPISRILQNESKVFLWEWEREGESIYNKHILTY